MFFFFYFYVRAKEVEELRSRNQEFNLQHQEQREIIHELEKKLIKKETEFDDLKRMYKEIEKTLADNQVRSSSRFLFFSKDLLPKKFFRLKLH